MPLTLTVALIALLVIALVGFVGSLIDNAEEKLEHGIGDRDRQG